MPMRSSALLLALLLAPVLAGCGSGDPAASNTATISEAEAMNAAAEMLDASPDGLSMPENAVLDGESGNGS
jgi:ABC-type uncharacterized transport system auxiliary subunit